VSGAYSGSRHDTQVKIAQGLGLTHAQLVAQGTGAASATPAPALTPEAAIEADPNLTKSQKEALLVHVRSYRRMRGPRHGPSTPYAAERMDAASSSTIGSSSPSNVSWTRT
jgi:hypothetical protein